MKTRFSVLTVLLAWPTFALAQMPAQAPMKIGIAAGVQRGYDGVKRNYLDAVDKLSDADYAFKPTQDVRSFGQLWGHIANAQFNACSVAKGEANPNQGNDNETKKTKAEFVKALRDSFAYCDPVYAALTDETAVQLVKQGQNEVARAVVLANNVSHNNEIYGTAAVYMRLKGVVPPSTERMQQMRK